MIIDGKKIRQEILEELKEEVGELSFVPIFCDILVGSDPVSAQYVNMKAKTAESVGIKFHRAEFPSDISTDDLIGEIKQINSIENMCGLIVQLPLPEGIDREKVLNAVDPRVDVDCLGEKAKNIFYGGDTSLGYPTALACMKIIDSLEVDLSSKNIVVFGQGMLVGKPVKYLLEQRGLQVFTITRKTENKKELFKNADLIIAATGQGKYITGDMIKEGAIIIDAGTSESDSGIVGDVDLDSVKDIAGYVSPVPGGVGPVTVAMLLSNVIKVAKNK